VHDWNKEALKVSFPAGPPQARVLAMVHVAMHDAINAVTGEYETYLPVPQVLPGTSSTAAGAWAAYQVLANLFPAMEPTWKAARDASVAGIAEPAQTNGRNVGVVVGQAMFDLRKNDGFSTPVSYTPGSGPGIWVPTEPLFAPALLPQFGLVVPFALNSGSQFRPDGPPGLTEDRYTADFNEIKIVGSLHAQDGDRTPEQTATAWFWLGNSIPIFQGIARKGISWSCECLSCCRQAQLSRPWRQNRQHEEARSAHVPDTVRNARGCNQQIAGAHRQLATLEQEHALALDDLIHLIHVRVRVQRVFLPRLKRVQSDQQTR
jgi:hypothetical protein